MAIFIEEAPLPGRIIGHAHAPCPGHLSFDRGPTKTYLLASGNVPTALLGRPGGAQGRPTEPGPWAISTSVPRSGFPTTPRWSARPRATPRSTPRSAT